MCMLSNLHDADDATLIAEHAKTVQALIMKIKERNKKKGLSLNLNKTKLMSTGIVNRLRNDNEDNEVGDIFYLLGSAINSQETRS